MHTTRTHTPRTSSTRIVLGLLIAVIGAGTLSGLAGCRGDRSRKPPRQFFPGMDDQRKWKSQTENDFFADGRSMRPRVEGTVAFSRIAIAPAMYDANPALARFTRDRADLLGDDAGVYSGTNSQSDSESDGEFLTTMPVDVDIALINRGRERYDIFCSMCHGYDGDSVFGERPATVGLRFAIAPANLHDPKYADPAQRQGKDGYLFNVIRHGVWSQWDFVDGKAVPAGSQSMPGYAHGVNVHDAWAIVAYVRTLQQLGSSVTAPVDATGAEPELTSQPEGVPNPPSESPSESPSEPTSGGEG